MWEVRAAVFWGMNCEGSERGSGTTTPYKLHQQTPVHRRGGQRGGPRATLDGVGSEYKKKIFIFGSFWNHPGLATLARLQGLARGVELWFWLVWDEGGGQGAGRASRVLQGSEDVSNDVQGL